MRPLEPIRVSLSTGAAQCGCCNWHKVTICRGDKSITFSVCADFAAWFRRKYAGRRPRLTRVWKDLDFFSWVHYAMYHVGGEAYTLIVMLITANHPLPLDADHARRCLPPDLIEALVAEKLDTM